MIRINLLAKGPSTQRSPRMQGLSVPVGAISLFVIGYSVYLHGQRVDLRTRAAAADVRLAESAGLTARGEALMKRREQLATDRDALYRALDERRTPAELLEAISRSVTDELWLTEVKWSALNIQVEGVASSLAPITAMIHNLVNGLSFAQPPEIRSVTAESADGPRRFRFHVAGQLAAAGEGRP